MTNADPEAPYGRRKDGTPRKPTTVQIRNEARGYVSKGAGKGEGWGGAATGEGNKAPFTPDIIAPIMAKAAPDDYAARVAARKARGEALVEHIEFLALNAESEQTQLAAAIAGANRLLGAVPTKLVGGDEDEGDKPINANLTVTFIKPNGG